MANDANAKTTRLDLRVTSDVKQTIERAASMMGESVTNFVLGAAIPRARQVIHESALIQLSRQDRDRFLAALDHDDSKPNAALLQAAERYKAATR